MRLNNHSADVRAGVDLDLLRQHFGERLSKRIFKMGNIPKRPSEENIRRIKFRRAETRRSKRLFVVLSQFSTTTFSVPVRQFRTVR
jgi:hypothetical protein